MSYFSLSIPLSFRHQGTSPTRKIFFLRNSDFIDLG